MVLLQTAALPGFTEITDPLLLEISLKCPHGCVTREACHSRPLQSPHVTVLRDYGGGVTVMTRTDLEAGDA